MAVSERPRFIRGIWGPYFSAMIPGLWLTEGGQSATGALIDHVIFSHAAAAGLAAEAKRAGRTIYELLNARLDALAKAERVPFPAALTRELHVQPDFHGNRSPRADPTLRGVVSGLTLSATADDLARQYLAAIQAVAYGTRHIIEAMNRRGYAIDTVLICGGGTKNPVFCANTPISRAAGWSYPPNRRPCCWARPCWAQWPAGSMARSWGRCRQ
jgi:ribulose kinase